MATTRLVPIKLSEAERESINSQLNVQEVSRSAPKSLDPKHFPVFEVQVGKKVLIYVPNHTITTENGEELSTREIKAALKELIENEDKRKPLSDDVLSDRLKQQGYPVARRTVAKYRDQMGIPVARLRK